MPPFILFAPDQVDFVHELEGPLPDDQILQIRNGGTGRLNWQISTDCPWLTATPDSGSSTGEQDQVTLSVDTTGLYGQYNCQLTIYDPNAANSPQTVNVALFVDGYCMKDTHPDYATWIDLDKPDCWCYSKQCKGDAGGISPFGGAVAVFSDDLDIFLPVYGLPGMGVGNPGLCADFDHKAQFGGTVRVFSDDLDIFLPSYGAPRLTDCDNTHFNYWVTPW